MRKHGNLYTAIGLAIGYWLTDSAIHWLVDTKVFEFLPDDTNELLMRVLIVCLLVAFGFCADHKNMQLLKKEEEKHRIFRATVLSTQHILNNLLNCLSYFKMEIEEKDAVSDEVKQLFNETLEVSKQRVQRLSEVEDPTEEKIKQAVLPK